MNMTARSAKEMIALSNRFRAAESSQNTPQNIGIFDGYTRQSFLSPGMQPRNIKHISSSQKRRNRDSFGFFGIKDAKQTDWKATTKIVPNEPQNSFAINKKTSFLSSFKMGKHPQLSFRQT